MGRHPPQPRIRSCKLSTPRPPCHQPEACTPRRLGPRWCFIAPRHFCSLTHALTHTRTHLLTHTSALFCAFHHPTHKFLCNHTHDHLCLILSCFDFSPIWHASRPTYRRGDAVRPCPSLEWLLARSVFVAESPAACERMVPEGFIEGATGLTNAHGLFRNDLIRWGLRLLTDLILVPPT